MRRALAGLVAVAALAGCSSSSDGPKKTLTLEPSTTTTIAAGALAARLPGTTLAGFSAQDPADLDLAGAAESAGDASTERRSLERHGFVRGVSRRWDGPDGDAVYVALYEFRDPAGAAAYAADQAAALRGLGATPFPGGFTTVERDGDTTLTTHAAVRQEGPWWALVLVASQSAARTPQDAIGIAASIRL